MTNLLCEKLQIEFPIIQGPLAWKSLSRLVAAVADTGSLGVLGSAYLPLPLLKDEIRTLKMLLKKPFAVNIVVDDHDYLPLACDLIIAEAVPIVYLSTLSPARRSLLQPCYQKFRQAKTKIIAKVHTLEEAWMAAELGADVLVAKGLEGGGYFAKVDGRILLEEIKQHIQGLPIVASGGIVMPRQAAGCIVAGADGIEMGTRFLVTEECYCHENIKQAIINAKSDDIVVYGFSTGQPSWQIKNSMTSRLRKMDSDSEDLIGELIGQQINKSLKVAAVVGDVENEGIVISGPSACLVHELLPVRQIIPGFFDEWNRLLQVYGKA